MSTPLAVAGSTGIEKREPLELVLTSVCPNGHARTRILRLDKKLVTYLALLTGTILVVTDKDHAMCKRE